MAKKKQNTGKDITTVKNSVGVVIVSITDDNMVMIRTEMHGVVLTYTVMTIEAAHELGIQTQRITTIGELEKSGEII
jgi:hypothetical protein